MLTIEATTPESRHAWLIGSQAEGRSPGATEPTDEQKAAAKAKLDGSAHGLAGGKTWEDVAKTARPTPPRRPRAATSAGCRPTTRSPRRSCLTALFAAPANSRPPSSRATDGIFRIGRVTEIAPAAVDPAYEQKIKDDRHRPRRSTGKRSPATPSAEARGQGRRRRDRRRRRSATSSEIFIPRRPGPPRRRGGQGPPHPVLAERRSRRRRRSRPTTPRGSWPRPRRPRPMRSSRRTRAVRRDRRDRERRGAGPRRDRHRRQAALLRQDSQVDQAFKDAVFAAGRRSGPVLKPVKSAFGWHVIQFMYRRTGRRPISRSSRRRPTAAPTSPRSPGTYSEAHDSEQRRRHRLGRQGPARLSSLTDAIFAAPVGRPSEPSPSRRRDLPLTRSSTSRPGRPTPAARARSSPTPSRTGTAQKKARGERHPRSVAHGAARPPADGGRRARRARRGGAAPLGPRPGPRAPGRRRRAPRRDPASSRRARS